MIDSIEEVYPEGREISVTGLMAPIHMYQLGVLAGLKSALGEYPSFVEIDLEEFMESVFNGGAGTSVAQ